MRRDLASARRDVTPSARRLLSSMRDIGYSFETAIADLVDNSISAGASAVDVLIEYEGSESRVVVSDDGCGMTESQLTESLRLGTRRDYKNDQLGRFGLGLKTASLSQSRRLTVLTRQAESHRRLRARSLDLDRVIESDRWEICEPKSAELPQRCSEFLNAGPGTVVIWDKLDRLLPDRRPDGPWARRRFEHLAARTSEHLAMVFHRFLERRGNRRLKLTVNGILLKPWNPFAPGELHRQVQDPKTFRLPVGKKFHVVDFRPFVLPPKDLFSSPEEFERLSGPEKWNRQQGLYFYRADRLIQCGGWCGLRAADEHTKLARIAIDFGPELDEFFRVNVAKMRVGLPPELRTAMSRPIAELCARASKTYRRHTSYQIGSERRPITSSSKESQPLAELGVALHLAAIEAGEEEALWRILGVLQLGAPDLARGIGLTRQPSTDVA